jgi:hypothetical protein
VSPETSHADKVVLKLGKLNLEFALGATSMKSEDVKNHSRPVKHWLAEDLLKAPFLSWSELIIGDHQVGVAGLELICKVLEAALP